MAATVVVQCAPPELTGWSSDLLDCCDDMNSCCYAFWCLPCFACTTTKQFGERRCLPLLDVFTPALAAAFGIPLCVPPAGLALRIAVRHKYGIKGTLCKDVMASCFCGWCSWCQLAREMERRKAASALATVPSHRVVVNVQPPPTTTTTTATTMQTTPQVQMLHQQSFAAPAHGYGPVAPAPVPVAPVCFSARTAAPPRGPSALGGGAYQLPGYLIQSDFL
ncbi:hypothetical protein NHX12_033019 [Muraenolepis orangiensis]|uniref:Cornifelin n=1 Tax=Muraenolepis orangiensis TaxID=630683 RepID=A0A9Q0E4B1_9TELE|nr:hypothetical protein NHX12_033019 [Muraenolepis orangiensis]